MSEEQYYKEVNDMHWKLTFKLTNMTMFLSIFLISFLTFISLNNTFTFLYKIVVVLFLLSMLIDCITYILSKIFLESILNTIMAGHDLPTDKTFIKYAAVGHLLDKFGYMLFATAVVLTLIYIISI